MIDMPATIQDRAVPMPPVTARASAPFREDFRGPLDRNWVVLGRSTRIRGQLQCYVQSAVSGGRGGLRITLRPQAATPPFCQGQTFVAGRLDSRATTVSRPKR